MATCETCRFWDKQQPQHTYANCRRLPPRAAWGVSAQARGSYETPIINIYTRSEPEWPNTNENDWCGEHQPKEPTP